MSICYAPEAAADFSAMIAYVRERNPAAARRLAERVLAVIDQLDAGDYDGPEQQMTTGERVRS